jgi:hypothetical protein
VRDLELIAKATDLEDYTNQVEYLPLWELVECDRTVRSCRS